MSLFAVEVRIFIKASRVSRLASGNSESMTDPAGAGRKMLT